MWSLHATCLKRSNYGQIVARIARPSQHLGSGLPLPKYARGRTGSCLLANLKTVKALGIEIPLSMLMRVDEVIK